MEAKELVQKIAFSHGIEIIGTDLTLAEEYFNAGKQEGIKEVVEWLKTKKERDHYDGFGSFAGTSFYVGKIELKERGIE